MHVSPVCWFVHQHYDSRYELTALYVRGLHPIPGRFARALLLHGGRLGATPLPLRPGPRLLQPAPAPARARPRDPWEEAEPLVAHDQGALILDDSTLDKPYARRSTWSPATGRASTKRRPRDQPDHLGLDRRRPQHPLRLPDLRQGPGRPDQERPLPGDAAEAKARGFAPRASCSTAGTPAWRTSSWSATSAGPG